jgi:hypothetical protein
MNTRLLFVSSFALATACGPKASGDNAYLGTWTDGCQDGGAQISFANPGSGAQVVGIIDGDGEIFEVRSSGFQGGAMTWEYLVPSTGYVVTSVVTSVSGNEIAYEWSNVAPDGERNAGTDVLCRNR